MFGNQGALYKNAMTWWDHETGSVWSQVTGEALYGPLRGVRLRQIPAAIETWSAWRAGHPDTSVLVTPRGFAGEGITPDFVIGVRIGEAAAAFRFPAVVERGLVQDVVGGEPLAVYATPEQLIRVYSRDLGDRVVDLVLRGGLLVDPRTGTAWDPRTGRGVRGPLVGRSLSPIPWASSFDWAWADFHPDSRFVG